MKGKLFKRLVSGALALLMLGTALPPDSDFSGLFGIGITASAEAFSGKCGDHALCEIEDYAFSGCFRLATINCLVADPSELTLGDLSGDFIFEPKKTTICYVPKGTLAAYEAKFASGAETDPNVTFAVKPPTLTIDDDITGGTVTASRAIAPKVEKSFTLDNRGNNTYIPSEQKITETVHAAKGDTVNISLKATGNLPDYYISSLGVEDEPAGGEPLATGKNASYTTDVTYEDEDKTILRYMIWGADDYDTDCYSQRVFLTVVINWTESSDYGVGKQVKPTATADEGYTFKKFIVQMSDETEIGLDENNCFAMPDNDVFVSAEFTPVTYSISYYNTTGAVNNNPTSKMNGTVTLYAQWKINTYTLTLPEGLTVVGDNPDTYDYGETVKFKINDGKVIIGDVKDGNTVIKPKDGVYSVKITKDTTITAVTADVIARVEPTCTEDGNILYYQGSDGNLYQDTKGTKITKTETVIPATGHKFGEWKTIAFNIKNGTATQKRKCSVCGKSESRTAEGAVQRFAGENRYTTAAIVSSKTFEKADTVVIAFGENYPDALAAVPDELLEKIAKECVSG